MNHTERITVDPSVLSGKPIVAGTRLAVDFIVGLLAQGWSDSDILRNYPGLNIEDIRACLSHAAPSRATVGDGACR